MCDLLEEGMAAEGEGKDWEGTEGVRRERNGRFTCGRDGEGI